MRQIEDIEMSDDYLVLREVLDDHDIPAKALAAAIGRQRSQTYRYLAGESTIPSVVWRWIFERTRDPRIVHLITGEVPVEVVPVPEPAAQDAATIQRLIKMRREQIEFEQAVLSILEDGQIDAGDGRLIADLRRRYPAMMQSISGIYRAVLGAYETAMGKGA